MAKQPTFLDSIPPPQPPFEGYSKETFKFLHGLKKNNNKEWFEKHRTEYEEHLREPSKTLAWAIGEYFRDKKMPVIGNEKTSLFRINRDIRFSKDKSPYKTHIGIHFPLEGGKKEEWCGFYFSFEPASGKSIKTYGGGGVYMPMPPQLKRIRQKIAEEHKAFDKILKAPSFRKVYPEGLTGESLKRIPQGFEEDHPASKYLKMKSLLFNFELDERDLLRTDLPKILGEKFRAAYPVVEFLGRA
jgi:uncharacterized protein (TIGR02453 family)